MNKKEIKGNFGNVISLLQKLNIKIHFTYESGFFFIQVNIFIIIHDMHNLCDKVLEPTIWCSLPVSRMIPGDSSGSDISAQHRFPWP